MSFLSKYLEIPQRECFKNLSDEAYEYMVTKGRQEQIVGDILLLCLAAFNVLPVIIALFFICCHPTPCINNTTQNKAENNQAVINCHAQDTLIKSYK
jgi:hypothetical protein